MYKEDKSWQRSLPEWKEDTRTMSGIMWQNSDTAISAMSIQWNESQSETSDKVNRNGTVVSEAFEGSVRLELFRFWFKDRGFVSSSQTTVTLSGIKIVIWNLWFFFCHFITLMIEKKILCWPMIVNLSDNSLYQLVLCSLWDIVILY